MEFKILDTLDNLASKQRYASGYVMQPGQATFTERKYHKIAEEGYQKNAYVYAGLNLAADVFADVEVVLFDESGGQREQIDSHELLDLINRPNPDQGSASFKKELYLFKKLAGKSFTHAPGPDSGPNAGRPQQMYNWIPQHVKVVSGGVSEPIGGFQVQSNGKWKDVKREEVIYIRDFHPTSVTDGHSPILSAARAVDVSNAQFEWNYSLLKNKGIPAHVFSGFSSLDQAEKWREKNKRDMAGQFNAGKDLYLPEGFSVEKLGMNSQEMDWINGMKEIGRIILAAIGPVPSELLNDGANKTYSNMEQAIKVLVYHNVLPVWKQFIDGWNTQLVPRFEGRNQNLVLEIDIDGIESLQESLKEKFERGAMAYNNNLAPRGEARDIMGLDSDVPDKDRYVIQSSMIPEDFDAGDIDITEEELNENGQRQDEEA